LFLFLQIETIKDCKIKSDEKWGNNSEDATKIGKEIIKRQLFNNISSISTKKELPIFNVLTMI